MKNIRKICLLIWKNYIIQKRHPFRTVAEFLIPMLISVLLIALRFHVDSTQVSKPIKFEKFTLADCVESSVLFKKPWFVGWSPASSLLANKILTNTDFYGAISLKNASEDLPSIYLASCNNETEIEDLMSQANITHVALAAISFDDSVQDAYPNNDTIVYPRHLKIKIRFPGLSRLPDTLSTTLDTQAPNWKTNLAFPLYQPFGPRDVHSKYGGQPGYCEEGYIAIQNAIFESAAKVYRNREERNAVAELKFPTIEMQRFPYPPYTKDQFLPALILFVSIFIVLSYTYAAIRTMKLITTERETQMKEAMKLMGLQNWMHWTAWGIKEFIQWSILSIFIVFALTYEWKKGCVIKNTDPVILLLILLVYSFSSINYCFLISVCFNRANTAATAGGALWFLTYSPYLINQPNYERMSWTQIFSWSLISNSNIGYIFQMIIMYEGTGSGLQWSNFFIPVSPNDKLSTGELVVYLFADGIIYLLLTIYIEAAFPGNYGIPLPWYFPFQATYWCGYKESNQNTPTAKGIQIRDLTKIYKNGKMAVKQLSLDIYPNQITVLLGHNGAGKSSSMSMLTGLIKPTSGTATIDGHDIWSEMNEIRDSLGLCPQYDLLFEELTIKEHLKFFGMLKGLFGEDLEEEIRRYTKKLDMESKLHRRAGALSGGYKRRLSVAIALVGRSKVVFLDEPTSGMDPTARRSLWDLLQAERNGRTMLMTTHLMDEADLLGDRVAILNGGQLKCVGTPFILKKKYGYGYTITLVKDGQTAVASIEKISALLASFNANIQLMSNTETELKYKIPDSENMANLLTTLSDKQYDLGIKEYGVSLTTLEDVYLSVTSNGDEIDHEKLKENNYKLSPRSISYKIPEHHISYPPSMRTYKLSRRAEGNVTWCKQLAAMLLKKILISKRAWFLHLLQIFITLAFLIIATIVTAAWRGGKDPIPLEFSMSSYRKPVAIQIEQNFPYNRSTFLQGIKSPESRAVAFSDIFTHIMNEQETQLIQKSNVTDVDDYLLSLYAGQIEVINEKYIMATELITEEEEEESSSEPVEIIRLHFNNQPYHSMATAFSMVQNALFKIVTDDEHSISFINHPLPYLPSEKLRKLEGGSNLGFQIGFNSGFAQAFVCSVFLILVVKERETGAKHLQFISGVKPTAYWLASILWDFLVYMGPVAVTIIFLYYHQDEAFSDFEQLAQVLVLMISFVWAIVPLMNIMSYFFKSSSVGFMKTSMMALILGCSLYLIVLIMEIRPLLLVTEANDVESMMIWFPHYSLCLGLRNIYLNHDQKELCRDRDSEYPGNFAWKKPGIGKNVFTMFIVGLVLSIILLSLENTRYKIKKIFSVIEKYWSHLRKRPGMDQEMKTCTNSFDDVDVAYEKRLVEDSSKIDYTVLMKNVVKKYGNVIAVKTLNLALSSHECFALLGANGAGKTTTFKMLTTKLNLTCGTIDICGMDIVRQRHQVSKMIGYCPQQDALIEKLTGRETLNMFCTLRGIPKEDHNLLISELSARLIFRKFLDIPTARYSGGNKRKLSTAIAMIGDPPVLLLDEPTSGMDPEARRHLWNVIKEEREKGKCIIITTHSLEECEALCTRLTIMVDGEMRAIGSVQHLKNKFASGYKLHVKFPPHSQQNVKWIISASLSGSSIHEEFEGMIVFHIPKHISYSTVFSTMEKAKSDALIEDYSIQQTTLEQVFIKLAKSTVS